MIIPNILEKGDLVGLVAPSSPTESGRVLACEEKICALGYQVLTGKSCFSSWHGYLAGQDKVRADDINQMFANPLVKAIFCIRGGYGCGRILEFLDYEMIRKNPKIFVGYSDITSIHLALQKLCKLVTYHAPMVSSNLLEQFDAYTQASFEEILCFGKGKELCFHNPQTLPLKVIATGREGKAAGRLIGGNLAVLINSICTAYEPEWDGKILFLEDIHESIPRIDRMMTQLRLMGVFDQVSAVLLGDFADCQNEYEPTFGIEDYLFETFQTFKIPVLSNLQVGHCFGTASLPLGSLCRVETEPAGIWFS